MMTSAAKNFVSDAAAGSPAAEAGQTWRKRRAEAKAVAAKRGFNNVPFVMC
jgi:hypothetical protein